MNEGGFTAVNPGDVKLLLASPEWQFGFNWHEAVRPDPNSPELGLAVAPISDDHYEPGIKVRSRDPDDPSFLRPPKDCPLATGGIGARPKASDPPLPAYVGAVPPEGVEPWDWDKTWKAMVDDPRVPTVLKRPADKARFNTIAAALDAAEEGMTVRVLDDAVYEEFLWITTRHGGVTLEAAGNATVRGLPEKSDVVDMRNVPRFTLRGLHFTGKNHLIHIEGHCPGTVLDRLNVTGNEHSDLIDLYANAAGTKDAPIVIQNCVFREGKTAVNIEASVRDDWDRPWPCGHVVIRNNTITRCEHGISCRGAFHQILVAGNCILETEYGAVDLEDPLRGTADVFIVNNTLFRNRNRGVGIWDEHEKGKVFLECKDIRFQNNLVLEHEHAVDECLLDHRRTVHEPFKPGDVKSLLLSPEWHFSHNWHELVPPHRDSPLVAQWIPPGVEDHMQVPIEVLSRNPGNPNFLRPAKDSPLAWSGAGGNGVPAADRRGGGASRRPGPSRNGRLGGRADDTSTRSFASGLCRGGASGGCRALGLG